MRAVGSFLPQNQSKLANQTGRNHCHTDQLSIEGKSGEIEGKIEGIFFRNRGQIEGILKGNREQNLFVYVQRFKGPPIPKHRLPSKYTIGETPSGTVQNKNKVTKK